MWGALLAPLTHSFLRESSVLSNPDWLTTHPIRRAQSREEQTLPQAKNCPALVWMSPPESRGRYLRPSQISARRFQMRYDRRPSQ